VTDGPSGDGADEPDDKALLAAHVAGDPEAFGVLFARHRERLWAVALRTTGDREEAADALQDALVAAFRRAGSYRGDAAVTTWLHRVVVNACLDRHRRQAVRRTEALPELERIPVVEAAAGSALLRPRTDADPEAMAERSEQRRAVQAALAQLPVDQRAALVLVDMQGFSVEEAAAVLDVAAGTVKSRCSRGRRRLAALLTAPRAAPVAPSTPSAPRNPGHSPHVVPPGADETPRGGDQR
jgi:RNA polymerase sigma-70 factor, ECF subfamily